MLKKLASFVLAGHCRLTISAAFTNVPRLIRRDVNLRGSTYHRVRAAKSSSGWVGENDGLFEHPAIYLIRFKNFRGRVLRLE